MTIMLRNGLTTLAFAGACLTAAATIPAAHAQYAPSVQVITNGPQSSGVEQSGNWSPQRNIVESERYSRLLRTNPQFRAQRMRLECGPISDPQLHDQCVQSFSQGPG
jgi:ABC-type transport system substrate-binding protein